MSAHESTKSAPVATIETPECLTLDRTRRGERFVVKSIDDEMARITAVRFGMGEGSTLACVTRVPAGPVVVRSGRQEIAIGRGLARRITVSPLDREGRDVC